MSVLEDAGLPSAWGAVQRVRWLYLSRFRGVVREMLDCDAPLVVVSAANGNGKSTVVEALLLLLTGYTARTPSSLRHLDATDTEPAVVAAVVDVKVEPGEPAEHATRVYAVRVGSDGTPRHAELASHDDVWWRTSDPKKLFERLDAEVAHPEAWTRLPPRRPRSARDHEASGDLEARLCAFLPDTVDLLFDRSASHRATVRHHLESLPLCAEAWANPRTRDEVAKHLAGARRAIDEASDPALRMDADQLDQAEAWVARVVEVAEAIGERIGARLVPAEGAPEQRVHELMQAVDLGDASWEEQAQDLSTRLRGRLGEQARHAEEDARLEARLEQIEAELQRESRHDPDLWELTETLSRVALRRDAWRVAVERLRVEADIDLSHLDAELAAIRVGTTAARASELAALAEDAEATRRREALLQERDAIRERLRRASADEHRAIADSLKLIERDAALWPRLGVHRTWEARLEACERARLRVNELARLDRKILQRADPYSRRSPVRSAEIDDESPTPTALASPVRTRRLRRGRARAPKVLLTSGRSLRRVMQRLVQYVGSRFAFAGAPFFEVTARLLRGDTKGFEVRMADGREQDHWSSGQKGQLAVSWLVAQNMLLARLGKLPHSLLLLDDVSTTYDRSNLMREALLWRQLAYHEDEKHRRQVFLTSHLDDLSRQLVDLLAPPAGRSMIVYGIDAWSKSSGPRFRGFRVEPARAIDEVIEALTELGRRERVLT